MKTLLKCVLAVYLIIGLSNLAFCEVVEKSLDTNNSWKCLDVEDRGWTQANYNDSWWESAAIKPMPGIAKSSSIWYPSVSPGTVYFRKTFEIDNLSIISANLYFGVAEGSNGTVDLYVNGQYIGRFFNTTNNPNMFNITSFLRVGKNAIAARVGEQEQFYWSLSGLIRYRLSEPITNERSLIKVPVSQGQIQGTVTQVTSNQEPTNQQPITQGTIIQGNTPQVPINQGPIAPYSGFGPGYAVPPQINQPSSAMNYQNTGFDASITIVSTQYKGYDVTVDGVYIGSDGKGGDPLDGIYSFKVAANQPHTIRVDHPFNWKYWSYWYFAGENITYYF